MCARCTLTVLLTLTAVGLVGCRGGLSATDAANADAATGNPDGTGTANEVDDDGGLSRITARALGGVETQVVAGPYQGDERFDVIAADWGLRVREAFARMADRTGLGFGDGPRPKVILAALEDERRPFEVRPEVVDGLRRPLITVNARTLVAGTRTPYVTLIDALAAGVFEVTAWRHQPVPGWVTALAAVLAVGDTDARVARLHRLGSLGDRFASIVAANEPRASEPTGIAVLLLLEQSGRHGDAARLLAFAAEGDDPDWILRRLIKEPDASWVGPAREALRARFAQLDPSPWRALLEADRALDETGRAGMLASLPTPLPEEIRAEVTVLNARGAVAEGDWNAARALLRFLPPEELAMLRDPAAALALRVQAEARSGGDSNVANEWMRRLDVDFPASKARKQLRERNPLLGLDEDPLAWLALTRKRVERDGAASLDLLTTERYVRLLLLDHRPGAAARFLQTLGKRARAPELTSIVDAVDDAQTESTDAARAANALRVDAWLEHPTEDTARDVRDGGRAAFDILVERLPAEPGKRRNRAVRLMAEAGGAQRTGALLAQQWSTASNRLITSDLEALAASLALGQLRFVFATSLPQAIGAERAETYWKATAFTISSQWLNVNPGFLRDIRSDAYGVRRAAFDRLVADGQATPEVLGRVLQDPASLLRKEGVLVAGQLGHEALAARGLSDHQAVVRQAACFAVARASGRRAQERLLTTLRTETDAGVRLAAAQALAQVSPRDPVVLDALVATQKDADARVRDVIANRLTMLPAIPVAEAVMRSLQRASRVQRPRSEVVVRWVLIFQRISKTDLGYYPEMPRTELQAMVRAAQHWLDSARKRADGDTVARETR